VAGGVVDVEEVGGETVVDVALGVAGGVVLRDGGAAVRGAPEQAAPRVATATHDSTSTVRARRRPEAVAGAVIDRT
jgi:hypothetical protein